MTTIFGSSLSEGEQVDAFTSGEMPVAIYGLGKMGLPLAAVFADVCSNVIGVDIDPTVVNAIEDGDCPVSGEPGLPALVDQMVSEGSLSATTKIPSASKRAQIHVAIVPTLLNDNQDPDLSILRSLLEEIGPHLEPGDIVFIESTVPPGTCKGELLPLLTRMSGLDRGKFGLAFCPERTSSGTALADIRETHPKVVGGVDPASTDTARIVYEQINQNGVITVPNTETAETVKIVEGVYRDVNIALANDLAEMSDTLPVDFREVTAAANTIPFINVHDPGSGVGGHCIPYYPHFLMGQYEADFELLQTAREVNESMPGVTVDLLHEQLKQVGGTVEETSALVLGVAYKPNIDETRKTPAKPILDRLEREAENVFVNDPVVSNLADFQGTPVALSDIDSLDIDAVVLVTDHDAYGAIDWESFDPLVIVNGRPSATFEEGKHRVYTIGSGLESRGEF